MEQPPVQILVVVAIIQSRTLNVDVGKGSVSTAFEYLLLPPRSALEAVPPGITPRGFATEPPRPPTLQGVAFALKVEYK